MNEPFDRGDINEASLAATERLRARLMAPPPVTEPEGSGRGGLGWAVALVALAFAGGMIASPWFEGQVRGRLPFAATAPAAADDMAALTRRLAALEKRAPPAPAVAAERLAATEARVESSTDQIAREAKRIDSLTTEMTALSARLAAQEARDAGLIASAQGSAERAESMLTVLLLRRAVEAGRPLDALLPAARRLFEPRLAAEVAALAAWSAAPATRTGLSRTLGVLEDSNANTTRPNWWETLVGRLDAAFSGGGADGPLATARASMARGDVAAAAAALRRSPALRASPEVRGWLASADRLRAAEAALATLEAAAAAPPAASAPAVVLPAPARAKDR